MVNLNNLSTLSLVLQLYKNIPKRKKVMLNFLFLLMILSAFSEILTLSSVLPFLNILTDSKQILSYPIISFFAGLLSLNSENISSYLLIAFIFIIISSGFLRVFTLFITFRVSAKIGSFFSNKFYYNLITQSYQDHILNNTSESLSSMTYHLDETIHVINASLIFLINSLIAISIVITLSVINFNLTFLSSLILLFFYLFISFITSRTIKESSSLIENSVNQQYSKIQESLFSIKDIILSRKELYFLESFRNIEKVKRNKISLVLFLSNFPKLSLEVIILIVFAFVGYIFLGKYNENEQIIGLLGVFALGVQKLLPNFQSCYSSLAQIRARNASIINVLKILQRNNKRIISSKIKKLIFEFKQLLFKDVSYRYFDSSELIISNLNLSIKRGDKIGIIGASGSGKSTFVDILMGLLEPSKGSIEINDISLNKNYLNNSLLDSWRENIGHVPQNIYMTNNAISENIAFGIEKKDIDYKKLKKAAKLAGLSEFIEKTELQYETCFGEDGSKLSGGQKQRVAIARALYSEPQILVLDEATSSLDQDTEKYILNSIKSLPSYITLVLISHRQSNLEICDRVYKFGNNKKLHLI